MAPKPIARDNIAIVPPDGPLLAGDEGALTVLGEVYGQDADWVAVPVERLQADFFDLANGKAGEFFQKFMNYRLKVAIFGAVPERFAQSRALNAFIAECNAGDQIRFADTFDLLTETSP